MKIEVSVESELSKSTRVKQLSAMFDVPLKDTCKLHWSGDLPIESMYWNVGLIVGPSGSGKTSIARQLFGENFNRQLDWGAAAVIDDFAKEHSMQDIASVCQAVGFNTIPAWMRPYRVLSNGEQFRADLARRLLELSDPIVVDEFTSVVDRQVAQIGAHAVQKYIRKTKKQFVALSCHSDILDWLQPDWTLEPSTMAFTPRRGLQRRPSLDITICRVPYSTWSLFAPFHYLTADLARSARCFCLFVGDRPASFAGTMHRPHPTANDIQGLSRLVTLPDWQGLGLAMVLSDKLGAAYKAVGKRFHMYPSHPSLVRSFDKSPMWHMEKKPGIFSVLSGNQKPTNRTKYNNTSSKVKVKNGAFGGRPNAVFSYRGPALSREDALKLLAIEAPL